MKPHLNVVYLNDVRGINHLSVSSSIHTDQALGNMQMFAQIPECTVNSLTLDKVPCLTTVPSTLVSV